MQNCKEVDFLCNVAEIYLNGNGRREKCGSSCVRRKRRDDVWLAPPSSPHLPLRSRELAGAISGHSRRRKSYTAYGQLAFSPTISDERCCFIISFPTSTACCKADDDDAPPAIDGAARDEDITGFARFSRRRSGSGEDTNDGGVPVRRRRPGSRHRCTGGDERRPVRRAGASGGEGGRSWRQ